MAVTKFLTRKTRLDTIIKYIMNGEKTEKMMYVSGVNCRPDTAIYEMQDTKKRFDKEDGIISYHLIQSFDGKEISPKKCHELGLQYAKELLKDKCIILGKLDIWQICAVLDRADLVLTTKLHVGIVSTALTKSVISFYRDLKTLRYYSQIGEKGRCVELKSLTSEIVKNQLIKYFEQPVHIPENVVCSAKRNLKYMDYFIENTFKEWKS